MTEFPFTMPFTVHVTLSLDVPATVAVKLALWPVFTLADAGDTVTAIGALAVTVISADAVCVPAMASIVTGLLAGTLAGAAYVAVSAPVVVTVPTAVLPSAMPFTVQDTGVLGATHSDASRFNVVPVVILDDAGEIAFAALHEMVTVAVALFVASATLVAVSETDAGVGGIVGAVYMTAWAPLTLNVPRDAFPPLTASTLQLTAELSIPSPFTVAVKFAVSPGATVAEVGVTLTTIPA